jgi:NADH:ubiquinone reductase (H+-translocating)
MVRIIKHIVIIGAGFAGLKMARLLNNKRDYIVTLIDKNNYHQFQPLLYQVAMANLDASNISFPIRNIFQKSKNVKIQITNVKSIDVKNNEIITDSGLIQYDYLVIATGGTTNYYGNEVLKKNVFPMKSTLEALQIRNTLLQHFEDAASSKKMEVEKLLSVIIVGGGPTGVELSGALAEMKRDTLPLEYPELEFEKMKIYLLEGSDKLLGNMSLISSIKSKQYLEKLGVEVKLNTIVKDYDGITVTLKDSSIIKSTFVIWAAGIAGEMPKGINTDYITIFNKVLGTKNIYASGDIASLTNKQYPKGYPQLASVAIDQAKNVASNFIRFARNKNVLPFIYKDKGSMATVGRNKAVVDLAKPKLSFQGFFAWIIWMTLHLFLLIGFKNKLIVFINWIYKYFTRHQSLSLIFKPLVRQKEESIKSK